MRDLSSDMSMQGIVPLVLHKIVRGKAVDWEDVHEKELRKLLDFIDCRWAVFRSGGRGPEARWMLTFDDGNISDYDIVFPLLIERSIRATFFLIAEKIGSPGYVDWSKIDEMHRHGMCIGSHSVSHRRMTALSEQEAVREFSESKQQLEDFLGAPVEAFSYPFGDYSPQLHQLGFAAGYHYLCTSTHGVVDASTQVIPRNSIHSAMGWEEIAKVVEPTRLTRFGWLLEDHVKNAVKVAVGYERYLRWRNRALG
uniref:polysaccharide deacetylase family protein n=1 Tax=Shewanella sp. TaxID=50422 RepID=UPI004047B413